MFRSRAWTVFLMLIGLALAPLCAVAEGSRNLYPSGYETDPNHPLPGRGNLSLKPALPGSPWGGGAVSPKTFLYVYAKAGEMILLGSSNRTMAGEGKINLYAPANFGAKGVEDVTTLTAAFVCEDLAVGYIQNRAKELAGPQSADGSANVAGYTPCVYEAPVDGVYGLVFETHSSAIVDANPSGVVDPGGAFGDLTSSTAAAWDVTVRSANRSSIQDIQGRLFTYSFGVHNGAPAASPARRLFFSLYYVTAEGYRYRQTLRGMVTGQGVLFANNYGFRDQGETLYKDILGANAAVSSPQTSPPSSSLTGVTLDAAAHLMFFSDVSPGGVSDVGTTLAALGFALTPLPPQLNAFSFRYPSLGATTTYVGQGGTFEFTVTDTISYQLVVSRDGVNWDPAMPTNRVLTGISGTGAYSVTWDGKDNAGNNFPAGAGYQFRITGRTGEVHFPLIDIERNEFGGPTVTKLNGLSSGDSTVYFDDRGYVVKSGQAVGTLNGNLCGTFAASTPQPVPSYSLEGVDSSNPAFSGGNYYRAWANGAGNGNTNNNCDSPASANSPQTFGDAKVLNLWTHHSTLAGASTLTILDNADVKVSIDAPGFIAPGTVGSVSVSFANVGSQTAVGIVYGITLGRGLLGVSCVPACTYNSLTGIVTVASWVNSLMPGQIQSVVISFTAPANGSLAINASATTTTGQGQNVAPDSAVATVRFGADVGIPIPTLSEWGLLLLIAVLILFGAGALKTRARLPVNHHGFEKHGRWPHP